MSTVISAPAVQTQAPASVPYPVAIICTLEELLDYADQKTRMFAVNISVAVNGEKQSDLPTPPDPGTLNLLQPWLWTLATSSDPSSNPRPVTLYVLDPTAPADPTKSKQITGQRTVPFPVNGSQAALNALQKRMNAELKNAVNISGPQLSLISWNPVDPGNNTGSQEDDQQLVVQHWPTFLSHSSTYPAPLPHLLNLVYFFTINAADVQTGNLLFLAPTFSINTSSFAPAVPAPVKVTATSAPQGGVQPGYVWSYDPNPKDDPPSLAVYQQGLPIQDPTITDPGLNRINLNTLWIDVEQEDGNEDWRSKLEQRVDASFDIARQVIDAFRNAPAGTIPASCSTKDGLDDLRFTVVSLLRDTADFGLRLAPDGFGTFEYVLDRAVRIVQQNQGQLPTGFNYNQFLSSAQHAFLLADPTLNFTNFVGQLKQFPQTRDSLALDFVQTADLGALLNALDGLHSTLSDGATLAAWLFQSWDSVLSSTSFPNNAMWESGIDNLVQAQLTQLSTSLTLRKRMLEANIGGSDKSLLIWTNLTKITDLTVKERDQMRINISQMIQNYYHSRIGDQTLPDPTLNAEFAKRNPPLTPAPLPPDMLAFLSNAIQSSADAAANQAFPPDAKVPTGTTPAIQASLTAQPVLLQVHTSAVPLPDVPDPLRSISGVCVLVRDTTGGNIGPWSCLNTASLSVDDGSPDGLLIDDFCFVPSRLANRNGLMQAVISYNNQPLSAPSPTSTAGKDIPSGASIANRQTPIFKLVYNPNPANLTNPATLDAWAHIAGLKYGGQYDFAAFAQRNSGALPKALADPNSPGFPLVPVAPGNFMLPPKTPTANVPYNRRVPVSGPRWATTDKTIVDLSKLALPTIPNTVTPIARELDPSLTEGADGKTLPLLLLWKPIVPNQTSDPSTYQFCVRPPSVQFDSWDRWVRNNPVGPTKPTDNLRKALYADTLTASPKGIATDQLTSVNNAGKPGFDASINDPAVTGLWFKLDPVPEPVPPADGPSCVVDLNMTFTDVASAPGFGTGFGQVQDNPNSVKVTVLIGPAGSAASVAGDLKNGVMVIVPSGQVFKLSVSPVIDLVDLDRFDVLTEGAQFVSGTDFAANGRRVVPVQQPMQMLIEIAASCGLSAQDLWNALTPGFDGNSITASIDRTKAPGDWRLIRRVDVTYEAWRWMGRPYLTKGFPATLLKDSLNNLDASGQPGPDMTLALNWESEAFTGRRDNNQKQSSIFFCANASTGPSQPNIQPLYSADLSTDLRAHYYLFGATMHSRYEGLRGLQTFTTTPATSIEAKLTYKDPSPTGQSFTPWKRCFVPCRIPAGTELAKPKILICVPLTTALQPAGYGILSDPTYTNSPPAQPRTDLLVLANEPWYQTAGLAERLSAIIELTSSDSVNPGLPEIGPDPTLFGQAFDRVTYATFSNSIAIGTPVGATFDEATDAPLFANTCFQLRVPQNALKQPNGKSQLPGSLDWCMAKLQLSRTINDTMRDTLDGPSPQSKPTEGVWVQLLPSSSHFNSDQGLQAVTDLVFKQQPGNSISLFYKKALTTPLELIPSVPPRGNNAGPFELWALLMNDITDAAGQPDEIYVGLFPLTHNGTEPPTSGNIADANHLYLLEVQQTQTTAAATNWRDLLFPVVTDGETNPDVTHRVVRVSARIEQSTQ